MIQLSEAHVTKQAREWLKLKGWWGFRMQSGTVRGLTRGTYMTLNDPGTPDWFFVRDKSYFFLEIKAPGKKLSPNQVEWFTLAYVSAVPCMWIDSIEMLEEKYNNNFGPSKYEEQCKRAFLALTNA